MSCLAEQLTDEEFKELVANSFSYAEISRAVGYKTPSYGGCAAVKRRIARMELSTAHFNRYDALERYGQQAGSYRARHKALSDEEFAQVVAEAPNWNQLMLTLGYSTHYGRAYQGVKQRVSDLGLDTSHFTAHTSASYVLTDEEVFVFPASCSQHAVRTHLMKRTDIPYVCAICGQEPIWNGKPLTLTMDHINGNSNDNRLENLRWICPNCDRQLPTYGARNKKTFAGPAHCQECGCELSSYRIKRHLIYCHKCAVKKHLDGRTLENARRAKPLDEFPLTRDELKEALRTQNITAVAKSVNLSDNALRKWLDKFGLPRHARTIRAMSDEEWASI